MNSDEELAKLDVFRKTYRRSCYECLFMRNNVYQLKGRKHNKVQ